MSSTCVALPIGVAVSVESVENVKPNTILVVIADKTGKQTVVKVVLESIPRDTPFLKLIASSSSQIDSEQSGCWVIIGGDLVWRSPCPLK